MALIATNQMLESNIIKWHVTLCLWRSIIQITRVGTWNILSLFIFGTFPQFTDLMRSPMPKSGSWKYIWLSYSVRHHFGCWRSGLQGTEGLVRLPFSEIKENNHCQTLNTSSSRSNDSIDCFWFSWSKVSTNLGTSLLYWSPISQRANNHIHRK